jgi:hypothetical protein
MDNKCTILLTAEAVQDHTKHPSTSMENIKITYEGCVKINSFFSINMQRMSSRNCSNMLKVVSSHAYHESNFICNILKKVFSMIP